MPREVFAALCWTPYDFAELDVLLEGLRDALQWAAEDVPGLSHAPRTLETIRQGLQSLFRLIEPHLDPVDLSAN